MKVCLTSLSCIALIFALPLYSCSDGNDLQSMSDGIAEYTTATDIPTETAENTSALSAKVTQADTKQTISFDKFTLQIPADFEGIIDEEIMGIYSTPYQYHMKLSDGESVFFGWGFEGMYPADTGKFDESAIEIAERHQKMCFGFESEDDEYVRQHPFYLNPAESREATVNGCSFVYQSGTMKRNPEGEHPTYYYEGYFGNIPYKNSAFNISQAPAMWIAFTNAENEEATEYVHTLIKQVTDSFSY